MSGIRETQSEAPGTADSPAAWALGGTAIAGAALLLAYASPLLLVASLAILAVTATANTIGHRIAEKNAPTQDWEFTAAQLAACMDNVNRTPDQMPGHFQEMLASQERAAPAHSRYP